MVMFSTKYPNNIRTVSGPNVPVFDTDVALSVNTSSVACSINLEQIPDDFWSTQWKLYIYDVSNNASVNNITINAGVGQTINGGSSATISTNGGGFLIRVLNNNQFVGLASGGSSGITNLTTTGTGGAAALIGNTLNIPTYQGQLSLTTIGTSGASTLIGNTLNIPNYIAGIIPITNVAIKALITANTVVIGQLYQITDAIINTGDLGVIVTGTSTNSVSSNGTGLFYNADYQGNGNYSTTVPTYSGTNRGIWHSTYVGAIVVGDVVVWNNLNYINLTGVWGTTPNTDTTNWLVLAKGITTGYILASNFVNYNLNSNLIIFRADNLGNQVSLGFKPGVYDTLKDFPWGNSKLKFNVVTGNSELKGIRNAGASFEYNVIHNSNFFDSTIGFSSGLYQNNYFYLTSFTCGKLVGTIVNNYISNSTILIDNIYGGCAFQNNNITYGSNITIGDIGPTNLSKVTNCTIANNSIVNITQLDGDIFGCTLSRNGTLNIGTVVYPNRLRYCEISDGNTVTLTNVNSLLDNFVIRKGYSNWEETLDYLVVGSANVITIPATSNFVGVFTLKNIVGTTLDTIVNVPTNHNIILKPDLATASTFRIVPIAVTSAATNQVIESSSSSTGSQTYISRGSGCDEAILGKYGELVGLIIKNIWL